MTFGDNSVLLVLSSSTYDRNDYIDAPTKIPMINYENLQFQMTFICQKWKKLLPALSVEAGTY